MEVYHGTRTLAVIVSLAARSLWGLPTEIRADSTLGAGGRDALGSTARSPGLLGLRPAELEHHESSPLPLALVRHDEPADRQRWRRPLVARSGAASAGQRRAGAGSGDRRQATAGGWLQQGPRRPLRPRRRSHRPWLQTARRLVGAAGAGGLGRAAAERRREDHGRPTD